MHNKSQYKQNLNVGRSSRTLDQLYVFMLIIYAGSATVFVRSISNWENMIGLLLPIVFTSIIAFWHRVKISNNFIYLLVGYLAFNIIVSLKFHTIHPRFFGIYLISFVIAYITISALQIRFFLYYERIIVYLSCISIFFLIIQILAPGALGNLFYQISFSQPGSPNVESNIVVYTINNTAMLNGSNIYIGGISLVRNSGFAWEPGGFASFIDLAIFVNLIRTRFKLANNYKLYILIFTLLTTFSTTGISILLIILVFFVYNQNIKLALVFVPITVFVGIFLSTLPFMTEKIIDASTFDTEQMIDNSINYETQYAPQRLESLQIDFVDFLNNPIFGYGGHNEERWTAKMGADIATISGFGKVMAVFGSVGILFFFYYLAKSSIKLANIFRYKGWFFFVLIMIMISISYSLIFTPLLMCFWLFYFEYAPDAIKKQQIINRLKLYLLKTKAINI